MSRFVWMLVLLGSLMASGCVKKPDDGMPGKVTAESVHRDASKAIDTVAAFSQQIKEDFLKNLETQIQNLDAEMTKLREKGRDLQDEAKASWEKTMAALDAKRDAARAKLSKVGNATAETWKDLQSGAQSAWDELNKAFQDASADF